MLAVCLLVFGVVAWVASEPWANLLDVSATPFLHGLASPTVDAVMSAVTALGSTSIIASLLVLALTGLIWRRHRRQALLLAISMAGSVVFNEWLKQVVQRPRPQLPWAQGQTDFSFPSGHAMNSLVFYVALALIVWALRGRRAGQIAFVIAGVLALLIGTSRIYLGYHYATDVAGGFLAGAAWLLIVSAAFDARPWLHRPSEMGLIEVSGLSVAFERRGHGPPVLLLHGFVGNSQEWRHQIDDLSDEFTVVAWDAPGAGRSSDPPETWRLADYADCLAAFIDALGLVRPHVVGLSFGGALALELYRRHPSLPGSLVLASAYAGWAGSLPDEAIELRLRQTLEASRWPPDELVGSMIPTMFSGSPPSGPFDRFKRIMLEIHPAGLRAMTRSLAEADIRDVLPCITVPTLLLYGDEDVRAPLGVAEELAAKIPASRLAVMPGVGHMSSMEAPERFNTEVRDFLRSVRG